MTKCTMIQKLKIKNLEKDSLLLAGMIQDVDHPYIFKIEERIILIL